MSVTSQLAQIAARVRVVDGFEMLWNSTARAVWVSGGDADFDPDQGTSWEDLRDALHTVEGVEHAHLAAESSPLSYEPEEWDHQCAAGAFDPLDFDPRPHSAWTKIHFTPSAAALQHTWDWIAQVYSPESARETMGERPEIPADDLPAL